MGLVCSCPSIPGLRQERVLPVEADLDGSSGVGDGPLIEFGAEFRDGERGTGFRYEVFGKNKRHEDGSFAKLRRGVES